jgi:dipeptidyl aminopeptidase/acylaminoacyl peptidase
MKRSLFAVLLAVTLLIAACGEREAVSITGVPTINNQLTEKEKADGILTPELLWKFGRVGSPVLSPDHKTVLFTVSEYDIETEASLTNIYSIPVTGGEPVQVTKSGGSNPQWFSDGGRVAFTNLGRLWSINPDGTNLREIKGIDNFRTYSISPKGDKIYFTRKVKLDETPNEKHNLPHANVTIANDLLYRHWDSWHDYSYSHIFVASFDGVEVNNEKDIMEGMRYSSPNPPFYSAAEIAWSGDGRYIAYTCKQLNGKEFALSTNTDIFLYDLNEGTKTNISEGNMGYDKYPVFSPDNSKIAFISMNEEGYESDLERLFIYDIAEGKYEYASKGWDFNIGNVTWTENNSILFTSPYLGTTQIFSIALNSGEVNQITSGVHDMSGFVLADNKLIAGINSMSMARELTIVDPASGSMEQLTHVNDHIFEHIKMGKVEERYIKTKDNKDLQMWIIYPPDFDPSKKYPALLYCKGGPQGPLGQGWSYRWNYQIMAANGYIVVAPNRRGNSGFGSEWREQISGDWGGKNIQDYLDAIDAMAEEPFVDETRLGAVGASYGGFSTFYLAGMHNDRFKAFISHCGLYNMESWYGTTEEYFFANKDIGGPYWERPQPPGYNFSPHLMVDKWNTPILIIAGGKDYRVPYSQSLEAFNAAQLRGVPSRLLFFHDENHWVLKPHNAIIWQREFFSFLDEYLK